MYRPEGIFRFFFAPDSEPPPPVLLQKANSFVPAIFFPIAWLFRISEGQKGTPGRGRDRKCHDRASLSRPLVLSSEPPTSLTSFPLSALQRT